MNTEKVAILGCAKNCANYIQQSVNNMINIGNMFQDYKIIIFENDSKDNTSTILNKLTQQNSKIKLITEKYISRQYPYRTWCIAYGRQQCSDYLRNSGFEPDYVIVMDLDDVGARGNGINAISKMMNKKELKAFNPAVELFADLLTKRGVNFEREYRFKKFHVKNVLVRLKKNPYRFDFAIPDKKIAFEINGGLHVKGGGAHNSPEGYKRDRRRDIVAMVYGWSVYRIPSDWLTDKKGQPYLDLLDMLDEIFKEE